MDAKQEGISDLWRRLLVTLAVISAFVALMYIPVPGVPEAGFIDNQRSASLGTFAIGPFVSAFLLVEFAALIVPPWRELRISGTEGRHRLRRASYMLALGFTLLQAWALIQTLQTGALIEVQVGLAIVSWVGAWALVLVMLQIIERAGLGPSFAILMVAGALLEVYRDNAGKDAAQLLSDSGGFMGPAIGLAVVIGAFLWVFRRSALASKGARDEARNVDWHDWRVLAPTMGLVSIGWAYSVSDFLWALGEDPAFEALTMLDVAIGADLTGWFILEIAIIILGGIVASWLFFRPRHVLGLWSAVAHSFDGKPEDGELEAHFFASWKQEVAISMAFLLAVFLAETFAGGVVSLVGSIVMGWTIALGVDLYREIAFRLRHATVEVADEVHRLYALPVVVDLIEQQGIATLARAQCLRSLLHFFGPHVPIEVLVPADRVVEARDALEVGEGDDD